MIIVKLQGGLGNQMFQYAAARSIADKGPVNFDTGFLISQTEATRGFTPRQFEFTVFKNIKKNIVRQSVLAILKSNKILYRLLRKLLFKKLAMISQTEKNEIINLDEVTASTVYLDGYFQNENYFKKIRKQLLHDFEFPPLNGVSKDIANEINDTDTAVSIHVRRGDYLKPEINAYHGVLPISYYQKAKKQIESQVALPHYFVFSDDPEWCKSSFSFLGDNATIVSTTPANNWEDMYLMSLCKHQVIANSSYSWWGAWLNKNPGKMVIAPNKWFVSVNADIVPDSWIKI